jgi:hypothetical protein
MSATYSVSISNELSNVTGSGRISKVRPGEGDYAGKVVNVSVAVSRRYPEMKDGQPVMVDGKASWKEITAFYDIALWGKSAQYFKGNVGDVVTFGFSLADVTAHPYTTKDGVAGASLKVTRADFIKVIARKNGNGADEPTAEAVGEPAEETIAL